MAPLVESDEVGQHLGAESMSAAGGRVDGQTLGSGHGRAPGTGSQGGTEAPAQGEPQRGA